MNFEMPDIRRLFRSAAQMATRAVKSFVRPALRAASLASLLAVTGCGAISDYAVSGTWVPRAAFPPSQAEINAQPDAYFVCNSPINPAIAQEGVETPRDNGATEYRWSTYIFRMDRNRRYEETTYISYNDNDPVEVKTRGVVKGSSSRPEIQVHRIEINRGAYGRLTLDAKVPQASAEYDSIVQDVRTRANSALEFIRGNCWDSSNPLPVDFKGATQVNTSKPYDVQVQLGRDYHCNTGRGGASCIDGAGRAVKLKLDYRRGDALTVTADGVTRTANLRTGWTEISGRGRKEKGYMELPADMALDAAHVKKAMETAYTLVREAGGATRSSFTVYRNGRPVYSK